MYPRWWWHERDNRNAYPTLHACTLREPLDLLLKGQKVGGVDKINYITFWTETHGLDPLHGIPREKAR